MGDYMVYMHTNLFNNKRYVGITKQKASRRWRKGNGYYLNAHFYRAIQRDGWNNFNHEIIKDNLSKEEACLLEMELIAKYKTNNDKFGYNKSSGGESPNEGTVMSDKVRLKMSIAHKGKPLAEGVGKRISEAKKNKSNGLEGRYGRDSQRAGLVRQIDINTGEIVAEYFGYYEMERKTGFKQSPIKRAVSGQQKQSYGFKWEYIPRRDLCHC